MLTGEHSLKSISLASGIMLVFCGGEKRWPNFRWVFGSLAPSACSLSLVQAYVLVVERPKRRTSGTGGAMGRAHESVSHSWHKVASCQTTLPSPGGLAQRGNSGRARLTWKVVQHLCGRGGAIDLSQPNGNEVRAYPCFGNRTHELSTALLLSSYVSGSSAQHRESRLARGHLDI